MATKPEHRVLSLVIQRKRYPAEYVQRYLMYRGTKLDITDNLYDELLSIIPEFWNTDKDRLVQFALMEDSTYMCVRNKEIYNYSRKETEDKTYFYNSATDKQVSDLVKVLTDFFAKKQLQEVENFYDKILASLSDMSYFKKSILSLREESLKRSDYMFNSDYTFSDSEIGEKWKIYRQEWRDITKTDAWVNNDVANISLPVSPDPRKVADMIAYALSDKLSSVQVTDKLVEDLNLAVDCLPYEKVIADFGSVSFKLELLKVLTKMNIPFYSEDKFTNIDVIESLESSLSSINVVPFDAIARYKSLSEVEGEDSTTTMKEILEEQLFNIDAKLEAINSKLKEYDVDFTISDILTKYVEDTKVKLEEADLELTAEKLLYELEGEEL